MGDTRAVLRLASVYAFASLALLSCGGGSGDAPATPTPPPAPVAPDPFPGVTEFLNLDLNNPANYANPVLPAHYAQLATNAPATNPVTDRGATLGRVIFYDKRLSVNNTTSCAICHEQARGFADAKRFSTGVSTTAATTKHAMRLGNVGYFLGNNAFWDKRIPSLEAQAVQPILSTVELGFDGANGGVNAALTKMRGLPYYPELFRWAFGDDTISQTRVELALAQFQRAMVSTDSKWDRGVVGVFNPGVPDRGFSSPIASFTAEENRGLSLFMTNTVTGPASCAGCHQPPSFSLLQSARSNGLDAGETVVFKSPSLKNVALSSHFMHDGRFTTLDEVVEHYASGIKAGPALDFRLSGVPILPPPNAPGQLAPLRLNLSPADKSALVAFMKTLTDPTLTTDPKFSDPFKK